MRRNLNVFRHPIQRSDIKILYRVIPKLHRYQPLVTESFTDLMYCTFETLLKGHPLIDLRIIRKNQTPSRLTPLYIPPPFGPPVIRHPSTVNFSQIK